MNNGHQPSRSFRHRNHCRTFGYAIAFYIYSSQENYDLSFVNIFRHCIDVYQDSIPDEDWEHWAVIFEDAEGNVTYRLDADRNEIKQLKERKEELGSEWYNVWRQYETKEIPDRAIVWPYSSDTSLGSNGWGPKIEVKIPKIGE